MMCSRIQTLKELPRFKNNNSLKEDLLLKEVPLFIRVERINLLKFHNNVILLERRDGFEICIRD